MGWSRKKKIRRQLRTAHKAALRGEGPPAVVEVSPVVKTKTKKPRAFSKKKD